MRVHVTLYFDTEDNAKEAGFYDAVLVDDDAPAHGYMAIATHHCDGYEVEEDFEDEDFVNTIY